MTLRSPSLTSVAGGGLVSFGGDALPLPLHQPIASAAATAARIPIKASIERAFTCGNLLAGYVSGHISGHVLEHEEVVNFAGVYVARLQWTGQNFGFRKFAWDCVQS